MSESQQSEYINNTSIEAATAAQVNPQEPETLATLPPSTQTKTQLQQFSQQLSVFLGQLPEYLGHFFKEYQQPLINVALIVAAIISLRLVFSAMDALNGIPLLEPILELIGIGYSTWFIYRYLLKESNRQELYDKIQDLKKQVLGNGLSPSVDTRKLDDNDLAFQNIDSRISRPKQPTSTATREPLPVEAPKEEVMAGQELEQKAVARVSESLEHQEETVPQITRPHLPDAELVEAAIHDAEEKSLDFSPPKSVNRGVEA